MGVFHANDHVRNGTVLGAPTISEFHDLLERLITDRAYREEAGARCHQALEATNLAPAWQRHLDPLYDTARRVGHRSAPPDTVDTTPTLVDAFGYEMHRIGKAARPLQASLLEAGLQLNG
jgi:hypothetical protein